MSIIEELNNRVSTLRGFIGECFVQMPDVKGKSYNADLMQAAIGLENLGYQVNYSSETSGLNVKPETPCVGNLPFVHRCIVKVNPEFKPRQTYPDEIIDCDDFWKRKIWKFQVKDVMSQIPCFMKPCVTKLHGYAGKTVQDQSDLIDTSIKYMAPDDLMWASEIVEMGNEWRVFIVNGIPADARLYFQRTDDAWAYPPNHKFVDDIVKALKKHNWLNYCLDISVPKNHKQEAMLVEVTDGYAFGAYGCNELVQAAILLGRWYSMVKGGKSNDA